MATNRILSRDREVAVQVETTYGTDPGAVSAGDFFKAQLAPDAVQSPIARYDRDQDGDYQQASVISTQQGRKSSSVTIVGDLIPSGNAATPTPPDAAPLFKALMGAERTATAHGTTTAGSSGVTLELTTGDVAAMGLAVGDMLAVDVDGSGGYEVRQVEGISTDTVTMDRSLSSDPPTGRTVKGAAATYRLDRSVLTSLYLKAFWGGEIERRAVPGLGLMTLELSIDVSGEAPVARVQFTGRGKAEVAHTDTRPTPTTTGQPLVPKESRVWFGSGASPKKFCFVGPASLSVNSGIEVRESEGCSLEPTGLKRTANSSRWMVEQAMQLLATTGDVDTYALRTAIRAFTYQDVLVQLGVTPGSIVAWRTPKYLPEEGFADVAGERAISFSGGRCYGTTADDEVTLAFI